MSNVLQVVYYTTSWERKPARTLKTLKVGSGSWIVLFVECLLKDRFLLLKIIVRFLWVSSSVFWPRVHSYRSHQRTSSGFVFYVECLLKDRFLLLKTIVRFLWISSSLFWPRVHSYRSHQRTSSGFERCCRCSIVHAIYLIDDVSTRRHIINM